MVSISKNNPALIQIDGNLIQYSSSGTILGYESARRGLWPAINRKLSKAKHALAKIRRFKVAAARPNCTCIKHLSYPTLIMPLLPQTSLRKHMQKQDYSK